MAIAFVKGTVTREPYFKSGENTPFCALSLKETYTDRTGEERLGGYHDVVAFGEEAQRLAVLSAGDELEVKASVRYRADKRFVSTQDESKNPFTVQFVVMDIISTTGPDVEDEEDPFPMPERVLDEALLYAAERPNSFGNEVVMSDLSYRAEIGRAKYDTYLTTENGRDALIDLYEEVLDAYMYAVQLHMEDEKDFSGETVSNLLAIATDLAEAIVKRNGVRGVLEGRAKEPRPSPIFDLLDPSKIDWSTGVTVALYNSEGEEL